ncbi:MAG: TetR/AcrR family transcriptional regulator [Pseudomonadales bacterium]|nr:TetR/AcrR family transcriptional regulator [Pseudomonadales bacterium]
MNTQSRRQREFQQREQLFLNTARLIIRDQGLQSLTMEKIAAETEYAKGTVYKHFANKEDLLIALCSEGLSYFVDLCEEAKEFPGTPREKLAIIATAYQVYSNRFPEEFELIMEARYSNLREKASEARIKENDTNDLNLLSIIHQQIQAAVEQGHLTLPKDITKDDICLGLWALCFGVSVLHQANDLLVHLDLSDPDTMMAKQLNCLLDGYGWRPLSHELDYETVLEKARRHLFSRIEVLT